MFLERLDLITTLLPVAALAQSLQGPCTLKELSLGDPTTRDCSAREALTSNVSLEVLDVRDNDFHPQRSLSFFELFPR
jgi:hypothetical protein